MTDIDLDYFKLMMVASYNEATKSPDPSTQNGAVLVGNLASMNWPIGYGFNSFPDGIDEKYWTGSKEDKYARVCHAEVSAILDAARIGMPTVGSTLICSWAACSSCAKYIARAGVVRLIRHPWDKNGVTFSNSWYDDCIIGDEIMNAAGIEIIEIDPVPWDGKLRRNESLWSPN